MTGLAALDRPMAVRVLDLSESGESATSELHGDGANVERLWCLVLDNGRPLGVMVVPWAPQYSTDAALRSMAGKRFAHELAAVRRTSIGRAGLAEIPVGGEYSPEPSAIAVVIATRERPELLRRCIESVYAGTWAPAEVLVVDNAPRSSRTRLMIEQMQRTHPTLCYVMEPRQGLASAHNAALDRIGSPLVAFVDDDVLVHKNWLACVVENFDRDPHTMCVTGMIAPAELDTTAQQWIESYTGFSKGFERRSFDLHLNRPSDPLFPFAAGAFGSGANMSFRLECLQEIGGFDAALGAGTYALGGDDLAAFFDVISAGHTLTYDPAAIVFHRHHREAEAVRRQFYGYGAGLTAHLSRCWVRSPLMMTRAMCHLPAAYRRGRAATVQEGPLAGDLPQLPRDFTLRHLRGMASGPMRYARSRRRTNHG